MPSITKTHWGGHLGLAGLTTLLLFTSCVTVNEQSAQGGDEVQVDMFFDFENLNTLQSHDSVAIKMVAVKKVSIRPH